MKFSQLTKYFTLLFWTISIICSGQNEYEDLLKFHRPNKTHSITSYQIRYNKGKKHTNIADSSLFDISYYDTSGHLIIYKYHFEQDTSKCNYVTFESKYDALKNTTHLYAHRQESFVLSHYSYLLSPTKVKRKYKRYFLIKETISFKDKKNNEKKYYYYNNDESLKKVIIKDAHETVELKFYYSLYK